MRDTLELCRELKIIQSIIAIAGTPSQPPKPRSTGECLESAEDILRHIEIAEQAASATELRDRLHAEALSLLAGIKRHVGDIIRRTDAGTLSRDAAGEATTANEALMEQFEDLRDKCYYPLMDVLQRISAIAEAVPIPADAITPERATQLFCVTRETLRDAVQDGELKFYRDAYEARGATRRYSEAHLARLYTRRR